MGMFVTTVAAIALAYGVLIILCSLNIGDRMAGKNCEKSGVQANNGLIVMGGAMVAFAVSYFTCQYTYAHCGAGPSASFLGTGVFSVGIIAVAITCIILAAIVGNTAKCIDARSPAQAIWVSGIVVLILGVIVGASHIKPLQHYKVMGDVSRIVAM
jgi:hypothetical protein